MSVSGPGSDAGVTGVERGSAVGVASIGARLSVATWGLLAAIALVSCTTPGPGAASRSLRDGSSTAAPSAAVPYDAERYREAVEAIGRFEPGGRITRTWWRPDGVLSFRRLGVDMAFSLATGELRPARADEVRDAQRPSPRRRGPARGRQREREESPDGEWVAVCRDWNVVIESISDATAEVARADRPDPRDPEASGAHSVDEAPRQSDTVIEVTRDGHRKRRYGTASWVYGEELRQQRAMWWSGDSRHLVFYEFDERAVPDFYLLADLTALRPRTLVEGYPKPGEPNPVPALLVYDMETAVTRRLYPAGSETDPQDRADGDEWYVYHVRFAPDGRTLLVNRTNRRQNVLHVDAIDVTTGTRHRVLTERQETYQSNRPFMRFLEDGRRFIWESERSGRAQYELRDLDGRRLATLTRNAGPVAGVVRVAEEQGAHGVLYYTAYDGRYPLDRHLFRVGLDGSDARQLTRERGRHTAAVSPDARWFTTRYESITEPPVTALYDTGGRRVATLAESDPSRAAACLDGVSGSSRPVTPPEAFTCRAADGRTTLYGWIHKPRGFDPRRRYPLVIDVYGGPESKGVRNVYRPAHPATELGFVVAKVDNRGTTGREKAFTDATYLQLGVVDLDDQAAAVRHLLRRPYLDPQRVGIYGHSYGGYMAALAMLRYPDLFSVGVAGAPVTDWRNYDTIYTERYMRTPAENPDGYDAGSTLTHASALRGRLLLLHGMVDDNVHPTNTWQLVEALQEAGRDFETIFYPNRNHGLRRHATDARWAFLCEHLRP